MQEWHAVDPSLSAIRVEVLISFLQYLHVEFLGCKGALDIVDDAVFY
jgi:hypothetical protein